MVRGGDRKALRLAEVNRKSTEGFLVQPLAGLVESRRPTGGTRSRDKATARCAKAKAAVAATRRRSEKKGRRSAGPFNHLCAELLP